MTGNDYQKLAMRTNDGKATERLERSCDVFSDFHDMGGIVNAALGLSGEVGELNDMIKKWIFHNTQLDKEHVKKEIGDVMWYVAMMCESFGFSLDDVMQTNVDKLIARYPDGFDTYRANHRAKDDV